MDGGGGRSRPIDPGAPFDAAAWLQQAEARGYGVDVTWDCSSVPPQRWLMTSEPEGERAPDDLALWSWLNRGNSHEANGSALRTHIERTRGVFLVGGDGSAWRLSPEQLAGRTFAQAAEIVRDLASAPSRGRRA